MSKAHIRSQSHPQAMKKKKIPNCSSQSQPQGRRSATKLSLPSSGSDSGRLPPPSVFPPRWEPGCPGEAPGQGRQNRPEQKGRCCDISVQGCLTHLGVPQTNPKLLQLPPPKSNCSFLSNSKLLQQHTLMANNTGRRKKKPTQGRLSGSHKELWQ